MNHFRPLRNISFSLMTSASLWCLADPLRVIAYDATRVGDCYFQKSPDSSPVSSVDGCEIVSSTAQGHYYYEIRFNAKRQYFIRGGDSWKTREEAPAFLNGKAARFQIKNGYSCWRKYDPYHEVCFK